MVAPPTIGEACEGRGPPALAGKRSLGGVTLALLDQPSAVALVVAAIERRSQAVFAFCNLHTFNLAQQSAALQTALARSVVFNDGVAMNIASRVLCGAPFPANLNGTDLTPALLGAIGRPVAVFLVGSAPGVAEQAGRVLEARFPMVSVVGCQHGFFDDGDSARVVAAIRAAGAELVLVGMGNPRQEVWASGVASQTGAVLLCVGAFLDFTAGRFTRAPAWARAMRCEWAWRLALEPRRLAPRYLLGGARFAWTILRERLRSPRPSGMPIAEPSNAP
jgi:N-acetylglucosaminyldiphosphoundecaprenol N-acetyl-beta-D-mannosaminyltransferase/alpha-1,3-mannosyltransferase